MSLVWDCYLTWNVKSSVKHKSQSVITSWRPFSPPSASSSSSCQGSFQMFWVCTSFDYSWCSFICPGYIEYGCKEMFLVCLPYCYTMYANTARIRFLTNLLLRLYFFPFDHHLTWQILRKYVLLFLETLRSNGSITVKFPGVKINFLLFHLSPPEELLRWLARVKAESTTTERIFPLV